MIYINPNNEIVLTTEISLFKINFNEPGMLNFLQTVYKSTRYDEMSKTGWSTEQIESFLAQQFQFQHLDYTSKYPEAQFYLIVYNEQRCGRLYIDYRESETRIIDIAILPEYRDKKIGSTIFSFLKDEAKELKKPISLHVENYNRARVLYERHGFKEKSNDGVYILMEFTPVE